MIPVLYGASEIHFASNGLGRLSDTSVCEVDEALNGGYELYMEYPVTGFHADEISTGRIILAKANDVSELQPFRIYSVTEELSGILTIQAQHISYDLGGYPVAPFNAIGVLPSLTGLVSNSMVANHFSVWTDIENTETPYLQNEPRSFRACLGGVEGSVLDCFGGEYEFDRLTVRLHAHRGSDRNITIRYAKNLEHFKNERSAEAYTGCLAYWTDTEGNKAVGEIQYIDDHESYAVERIFMLNVSDEYDDVPEVTDLNERAASYIVSNNLGLPFSDSLEISFVPLWQTEEYKNIASLERVGLGDTVHVVYRTYDVSMAVIEYRYDSLQEKYINLKLGRKKASFGDTIRQIASENTADVVDQAVSMMDGAINHAMEVISGGTGGHIVIGRNADGQPNEIYIMDSPDMGSALNVLRINYAGIAFSQTGINGTYTTAWTIDSNFVADFITAGTINGNLIRAGSVLTSALEVAVQTVVDGIKMNFSFLNDGLYIAQKDSQGNIAAAYQTLVSNLGMRVIETSTDNSVLIAEEDTVTAVNLTADQYLRVRSDNIASRFQQWYSTVHSEYEYGVFWEV